MKKAKSSHAFMRSLHRDIGFLVVGFIFIYAISGIVLIYRDTDFLKKEKQIERELSPNLSDSELGMALHSRNFKVLKTEGSVLYFKNGTYNKETGVVNYSDKALPSFLEKFNGLHKTSSKSVSHWFSIIFGLSLLFLGISSFWMFKPGTSLFRRGILLTGTGFIVAVVLLFL